MRKLLHINNYSSHIRTCTILVDTECRNIFCTITLPHKSELDMTGTDGSPTRHKSTDGSPARQPSTECSPAPQAGTDVSPARKKGTDS